MYEFQIPEHLIERLQLTSLHNVWSKVSIQAELFGSVQFQRGLSQDDVLSWLLLNISSEKIIRSKNCNHRHYLLWVIQVLAFADGIVIIGKPEKESERALVVLKESAHQIRLKINKQNTNYMKSSTRNPTSKPITIEKENIEYVEEFVYMGSLLNWEIKRRVIKANRPYHSLCKNFTSHLPRTVKIVLYQTLISPVLAYGSETDPK